MEGLSERNKNRLELKSNGIFGLKLNNFEVSSLHGESTCFPFLMYYVNIHTI
jgi:hypothetical protein